MKTKSIIKSSNEVANVSEAINEKVAKAIEAAVNECSQTYHRQIEVKFQIVSE